MKQECDSRVRCGAWLGGVGRNQNQILSRALAAPLSAHQRARDGEASAGRTRNRRAAAPREQQAGDGESDAANAAERPKLSDSPETRMERKMNMNKQDKCGTKGDLAVRSSAWLGRSSDALIIFWNRALEMSGVHLEEDSVPPAIVQPASPQSQTTLSDWLFFEHATTPTVTQAPCLDGPFSVKPQSPCLPESCKAALRFLRASKALGVRILRGLGFSYMCDVSGRLTEKLTGGSPSASKNTSGEIEPFGAAR